jgi:hypothetical protein
MKLFAPTSDLPKPLKSQAVILRVGKRQSHYQRRQSRRSLHPSNAMAVWERLYGWEVARARRHLMRCWARNWKHDLSSPQRAEWDSLAASIIIRTYQGIDKTPTGFQLFIACHFEWAQTEIALLRNVWPWPPPYQGNAPAAWDPPAAPIFGAVEQWDTNLFGIPVENPPDDIHWWAGAAYIKAGRVTADSQRGSYFLTAQGGNFISDDTWYLYVYSDYPLRPPGGSGPCSFAYRWVNNDTKVFSDPTWLCILN